MTHQLEIEILVTQRCASRMLVSEQIRRLLDEVGIAAHVTETIIMDREQASALAFPGSPTVRINGVDIDPEAVRCPSINMG